MKNLKFRRAALFIGTSMILVGCQSNTYNIYQNQTIIESETTSEENTTIAQQTKETNTIKVEVTEAQTTEKYSHLMEESVTQIQTYEAITTEKVATDEEVIDYIENLKNEMVSCTDTITSNVKRGFITIVDFLFYDGEIKGRTFDSLKDDAKSTVLGIYDTIHTYVEEKWPIWKEELGERYEQVSKLWDEKKETLSNLWQKGKQKVKDWYEEFRKNNQ